MELKVNIIPATGEVVAQGKTKTIYEIPGEQGLVVVENRNEITKHDDPSQTRQFGTKARCATETTCRIFELLKKAGIPVAYVEQRSPTEFVAQHCTMIPLEVVIRRIVLEGSSFLKRHPELKGQLPYRFHRLLVEYFLKTTGGSLEFKGKPIITDLLQVVDGEPKPLDDPLILNPESSEWLLSHPKVPPWEILIDQTEAKVQMADLDLTRDIMDKMEMIARKIFLVLENAWAQLGCRFIDLKTEFGITNSGELVVADVIDNDSWRLRTADWEELSKESFRQNEALSEVERKYGLVAEMVGRLRVPVQCLLLWRGSAEDPEPIFKKTVLEGMEGKLESIGLVVIHEALSGHKAPRQTCDRLEQAMIKYPEGGVIISKVGMSNGKAPTLAARTSWPVIALCASFKEFPEDVWSSLRTPSKVPLPTFISEPNAIDYAVRILAQKNPILYMLNQYALEQLDD